VIMTAISRDDTVINADQVLIGIDEVGRGAWAGPVVAGAVMAPAQHVFIGVRDSKRLTGLARRRGNRLIRATAAGIGIGWVSAAEIDAYGLGWAIHQSGLRALQSLLESLTTPPIVMPLIILDGSHNYLASSHHSQAIVRADDTVPTVSAASVIAKVARDAYITSLARRYSHYGFDRHKGYGTPDHARALHQHGPSPVHRLSVQPVGKAIQS
jgi:ribonuclease HII